ncbi:membrane protein DedA, SNARE-associated domain [Actinomadura meyerae]|jgi:membrane protein DedA with SNARE-associated domain|uniref:Membrane protein DedA, SNARE-associated domain n=1 Tax=Actinomadura meyerae TaxID=240840 RepID=A0A239IRQ8_9ACTN|nr:DedA family protein [Actinomadura meyerae]SNS96247.1 membrane protein DedA, SNARE-associated domain [Actinomadura meyerae]
MDGILGVVDTAVTSPWFYLVLFAVAVVDGFFPVVPSESLVITAGVYAASGRPEPVAVVVLAACGAFVGDHVSYLVGRRAGGRLVRGLRPGTRRHGAFGWARRTMAERGGLILVVARYVPGGRTAVTLTMGAVGYRLRWFSGFAALAAVSWALYGTLLGYVGGAAFEDDPVKGVAVGLGLALSVTGVVEGVRFVRRRRGGPAREEPVAEARPDVDEGVAVGVPGAPAGR